MSEYRFSLDNGFGVQPPNVVGHLSRYRVPAKQRLETIMSDGTVHGSASPFFVFWGAGAGALAGGAPGAIVGAAAGAAIDVLRGGKDSGENSPPVPVVLYLTVQVTVGPARVVWAEYLLLRHLIPHGWALVNPEALARPKNLELAMQSGEEDPTPWAERKTKRTRAKKKKSAKEKVWAWLLEH